jgi:hypothetical protein
MAKTDSASFIFIPDVGSRIRYYGRDIANNENTQCPAATRNAHRYWPSWVL